MKCLIRKVMKIFALCATIILLLVNFSACTIIIGYKKRLSICQIQQIITNIIVYKFP